MAYIKNDDTINHTWVGQLIVPAAYYQIQEHERDQWANDSQLLTDIGASLALVAEDSSGTKDFADVADGINYLKGITVEVKKERDWHYSLEPLKNSGSNEMDVDGSVSTVTFKWSVPAGEVWELMRLSFFILDPGAMPHNVFGALGTSLTNGCKIAVVRNGVDFTLKDIKDNVDVFMSFPFGKTTGTSATGFLDDEDYFAGAFDFPEPVKIIGDDGDSVKFIVKDDLTTIKRMRASALVRKKI